MEHPHATLGPDKEIARVATAQHGVIHFEQLPAAGLGPGAVNARVRAGKLHRLHRAVFAVGHTSLSRHGRRLAAVLALGEGALLSHVSAAGPLERAVERSLSLRLFDLEQTNAVIAANPRRPGASALARVIATMHDEPALTRSDLEGPMRDLCDAHGLPRPEVNAIVEGEEVDFLWRDRRLIVETDGHETHGTRASFERDRAKDARLTMLGYRVVRFTYRQLAYAPHTVVRTLQALLARRV